MSKRSASGMMLAVGMVALGVGAWLYLQDFQQAASSSVPSNAGADQDGGSVNAPSAGVPSAEKSTLDYEAQDDGAGGVKVVATVLTPGAVEKDPSLADLAAQLDPAAEIGFLVVFETHAGDLSKLDLAALSSLNSPAGDHRTIRWAGEDESSHHRSGVLVFSRDDLDLAAEGDLTITVTGVAGVPARTLTWLLPLQ